MKKKTKEKGWLRLQEAQVANRPEPKQNSHLNTPERELVVPVRTIITSVPKDRRPKRSRPNSDLAFAFGKTQKTIRNINKRVLEHNNNPKYQQRSDAGITVFDTVKNKRQFSLHCIILKSGNDWIIPVKFLMTKSWRPSFFHCQFKNRGNLKKVPSHSWNNLPIFLQK